jgi:hypothetical protein
MYFMQQKQLGDEFSEIAIHEDDEFYDITTEVKDSLVVSLPMKRVSPEYRGKSFEEIHRFADTFGMDEPRLRDMMDLKLTEANLNEYGRFDNLKDTIDKAKARAFFEKQKDMKITPPKANILLDKLLRQFLLEGGFELE